MFDSILDIGGLAQFFPSHIMLSFLLEETIEEYWESGGRKKSRRLVKILDASYIKVCLCYSKCRGCAEAINNMKYGWYYNVLQELENVE